MSQGSLHRLGIVCRVELKMGDSYKIVLRITIFAVSLFTGLSLEAQEWQASLSGDGGLIGYMCRVQPDFVACRPANVDEQRTPLQIETNWRLVRDRSSDNQQTIQSRSQRTNEMQKHFIAAMQIANVELRIEKRRPLSADDSAVQLPNPMTTDADLVEASMNNGGEVVIGYRNRNSPSFAFSTTPTLTASLSKHILPQVFTALPQSTLQASISLPDAVSVLRSREPFAAPQVSTTEMPNVLSGPPGFILQAPRFLPQENVISQQLLKSQGHDDSIASVSLPTTAMPIKAPKVEVEQSSRMDLEQETTDGIISSIFDQTTQPPVMPPPPPVEIIDKPQKPPLDIRRL